MNCKDCISYFACSAKGGLFNGKDETKEMRCGHFKDKSKMIEIPCNYGDTVYSIIISGGGVARIKKSRCHSVRIGSPNSVWCYANDKVAAIHYFSDFGKTAFLTLEEAEDALRKIKEKKK